MSNIKTIDPTQVKCKDPSINRFGPGVRFNYKYKS